MEGGELLAEGKILEREFGMGPEGGAKGGEQVAKKGEHDELVHHAISCLPSLRISALTDGKPATRLTSWRTPVVSAKNSPVVVRLPCGVEVDAADLAARDPWICAGRSTA